jgi:hypothetical protein
LAVRTIGEGMTGADAVGASDNVLCMAASLLGSRCAVATSDNAVRLFSIAPDGSQVSYQNEVCKFATGVYAVELNSTGTVLVCAGEDGVVRVYAVLGDTVKLTAEKKLHAAVLSLALDPKAELVAAVLCDGSVRLLHLEGLEAKGVLRDQHTAVGRQEFAKGGTALMSAAWHPGGTQLAVPGDKGHVHIYARNQLQYCAFELDCDEDAPVSCAAYSRNGAYLACCTEHLVHVWDVQKREIVSTTKLAFGTSILRLRWSPFANLLCVVTGNGAYQLWRNVVPAHLPEPHGLLEESADDELSKLFSADTTMVQDDDEDDAAFLAMAEQTERQVAAKKKESQEKQQQAAPAVQQQQQQQQKAPVMVTPKKPALVKKNDTPASVAADADVMLPDDDVDPFESPFPTSSASSMLSSAAVSAAASKAVDESMSAQIEALVKRFALRDAPGSFNPSATTAVSAAGNRRLLVWNRVGRAVCVDDRMESIVEVEFADVTSHRKIRVADLYSYTMGALSDAGVALAAAAVADQDTRAVVHFKPVAGLVGGAEWQELLEAGEDVLGVAAGDDWVAVVTAPLMTLRVWSVAGLQMFPLSLSIAKFVAMTGQGSRLTVFHHTVAGLHALVYDLQLRRLVFNVAAPVTPGATLTWCGYTPTGVVVTLDSAGVGRVLINSGDWAGQWVPLIQPEGALDLSRRWPLGWPIGATDDSLIVVRLNEAEEVETGLVLDDDNRGAPSIDTIRWNMPLVAPNSALSVGLETVLRRRLMLSQSAEAAPRKELEVDSEIVKLIALAAKNAMPQRTLELFRQLRSNQTRLVAMKWVGANGFDQLFAKMESEWRAINGKGSGELEQGDGDEDQEPQQSEWEEQPRASAGKRRGSSEEVYEDDMGSGGGGGGDARAEMSNPAPTKQHKSVSKSRNPFSAKASAAVAMRRTSSSGGVLEALARIESKK